MALGKSRDASPLVKRGFSDNAVFAAAVCDLEMCAVVITPK